MFHRTDQKTLHYFEAPASSNSLTPKKIVIAANECVKQAEKEKKILDENPFMATGLVRDPVHGPLRGVNIPRYQLTPVKPIGAGQFGEVYMASFTPSVSSEADEIDVMACADTVSSKLDLLFGTPFIDEDGDDMAPPI